MKKLLRILPYFIVATLVSACQQPVDTTPQEGVWVAMYVKKETGKIAWKSDNGKANFPREWTTKKQCMKAALRAKDERSFDLSYTENGFIGPEKHKPVCYRLTKYSTR